MFFYLYTIFALSLYIVAIPFLLLFSLRSKYRESIPARFFLWKNPPLEKDGVWFHVCSYGEAKAIEALVESVPPNLRRLTTTTQTGKHVIDTYSDQSRYLPFEPLLLFWMRRQKALVVMEAELWYLLFTLAKRKGARTLLINARISDRSYRNYLRLKRLYRHIFASIDEVYAQTERDKVRLERLGAKHVTVTGNVKLAYLPEPKRKFSQPEGITVCAASTHSGEEEMILEAFAEAKAHHTHMRLVLIVRHPERFEAVAEIVKAFVSKRGLRWHRWSEREAIDADIVLIDMMGLSVSFYAISDVVIMGGTFVPVGGHNVAEAAQFGCKIISGEHYFNQRDLYRAIEGIRIVSSKDMLAESLIDFDELPRTHIVTRTNIDCLFRAIRSVIEDGK